MITAYTQTPTEITETTLNQKPDWINVIEPEREEVDQLIEQFNVPEDFLRDPLDSEESARIEYDDETGYSLIIIDLPVVNSSNLKVLSFITQPLGIIIGNKRMFTVCDTDNEFLENFARFDSEINLKYRSQFALNILLTIANHYNRNLRLLNKSRLRIEKRLKNNVTNKQLYNLMEVEKSLVYFLAALKGNDNIIKKLFRLPAMHRYEEDEELLEDLVIENNQAIETTELYTNILESITTSYSSLLSNEMNNTMKTLTLFTVFLTLPTLVFSFFGMNVPLPIDDHSYVSWLIIIGVSLILVTIVGTLLWKKRKF
ncbi:MULTISPECIES: magnesium transporter CorA family protein [Staphylococcus]|uniref:Magnesium transporter CorA family protein n=1 Tax=Staphylococcus pettenkoferi TaxID=170573 RepID=A0A2N6QFK7_9STAP|nr:MULTISPECIES: magnesium transporter CorA family protein [Staphylococcus]MBX8994405.1 magnesium transporter CorA family protein [Staphylococcus pettenkoferi]MCI2792344.1 magnesium transporter CorA family protein [Staphylococcus pettenkoferi]MCY1567831.1 magnesium transporter CorA family protein [Staphylococcus pettenkoferi]MCY1588159.1 magnesium transporter CorA family protein [Staphylococcus pettenkoferi]MCY1605089.1 magnesium transporter CorA family protein [Staphylococcus pettenkoferi]